MKYRILIVEDYQSWQKILDSNIRSAIQNISDADCDIKIVDNFDEAYTFLNESSWDLLVTDLGLGNDDLQPQKLGKQIAEIAYRKSIPAIVVSGTDHLIPMDIRDIFTKIGASDFFYKQAFDSQEFIKKVQEVLQNQQQSAGVNLSSNDDYRLTDGDRQYLVKTLSSLATNALIPAREYFRKLVQELRYPEDWKNSIADVWSGDANRDAEGFIKWCEQKRTCPQDYCESSGYTVLGCLVEKLLEETADIELLNIIARSELIIEESVLNQLKEKY
ncbi:MAG: hypothetical protein AAF063_31050 [Cyanobacteria bacterium J06643_5]